MRHKRVISVRLLHSLSLVNAICGYPYFTCRKHLPSGNNTRGSADYQVPHKEALLLAHLLIDTVDGLDVGAQRRVQQTFVTYESALLLTRQRNGHRVRRQHFDDLLSTRSYLLSTKSQDAEKLSSSRPTLQSREFIDAGTIAQVQLAQYVASCLLKTFRWLLLYMLDRRVHTTMPPTIAKMFEQKAVTWVGAHGPCIGAYIQLLRLTL
eukprot:6177273-Pleurochrysis_carterae.AAC.1